MRFMLGLSLIEGGGLLRDDRASVRGGRADFYAGPQLSGRAASASILHAHCVVVFGVFCFDQPSTV